MKSDPPRSIEEKIDDNDIMMDAALAALGCIELRLARVEKKLDEFMKALTVARPD